MASLQDETCIFCGENLGIMECVKLTEKGCQGIRSASEWRDDNLSVINNQMVHVDCRKRYCNKWLIDKNQKEKQKNNSSSVMPNTRSTQGPFLYKEKCIFCGNEDRYAGKKKEYTLIKTLTLSFQKNILDICDKRNDDWGKLVKQRIQNVFDITAADAVYHQLCSVNFRTSKNIPNIFSNHGSENKNKRGRPIEETLNDVFLQICDYVVENPDEKHTLTKLILKMDSLLPENIDPYSSFHLKNKLKSKFGDKLILSEYKGKETIITLRETASSIIHIHHQKSKINNINEEKLHIISTAAALIKSDISEMIFSGDVYPSAHDLSSYESNLDYLPDSLKTFLQVLFTAQSCKSKVSSVGQAIIQSTRPRSLLCPLQVGLGVQLHHHFGSKFLIDTLYQHGFACSYNEVQRFEKCAAFIQGGTFSTALENKHIEFIADNVDHNLRTIDGFNTIHAMGMIAAVTPGMKNKSGINRFSPKLSEIKSIGHINIKSFVIDQSKLNSLTYETYHLPNIHNEDDNVNFLWNLSSLLLSNKPSWSGVMQNAYTNMDPHCASSSFLFLPIINLDASNISCIYTTLLYISDMAVKCGKTPIITFDQPLWFKASQIIESSSSNSCLKNIILKLGGFHILMSFLGAIGTIMAGTGIKESLELVYASSTVSHMLSGKAYSRAVRGHLLVVTSLYEILYSRLLSIPISSIHDDVLEANDFLRLESFENNLWKDEIREAKSLIDLIITGQILATDVLGSDALSKVKDEVLKQEKLLVGPMCKLWLQYIEMVNIMRQFLQAERTGNWKLHLKSLNKMLPYLAAAGHNNYTKSVHLYLQKMSILPHEHPDVYQSFIDGMHVIRRSERYWSGLSSDLVIEQVLMRSLKTTGGLTRGRGMKEEQQLVWLLSRPICAEINLALQQLTNTLYKSSEQHKDLSTPRRKKDAYDIDVLTTYLSSKNIFNESSILFNIETGICSSSNVNAHVAKDVGDNILADMKEKAVQHYVFRKKNQMINMENRIKTNGDESISVDPLLLFQRLVIVGTDATDNLFSYELCSYPPALFSSPICLLSADKSSMSNFIWKQFPDISESSQTLPSNVSHVIDGGALLHRIPWEIGNTWKEIFGKCVYYLHTHYKNPFVIFDGYEHSNTKDMMHDKRSSVHQSCPNILIHENSKCSLSREKFLANTSNKINFIKFARDVLSKDDISHNQAEGDADFLIAKTAISISKNNPVVVVGDDTDILMLLLAHTNDSCNDIYFRPEPKATHNVITKCWDIKKFQLRLGKQACENILFAHSFLGCDTTSRVYGLGKSLSLKKIINKDEYFIQQSLVFSNSESTKQEIADAGEKALVSLYKGEKYESLNEIRHYHFHTKVGKSQKSLHPCHLPPTSASAVYHSMRVYHQVQEWSGNSLPPEQYGWKKVENKFLPISTDLKPAPDKLLSIIFCNCKTGCATLKCSCKRFGLDCSPICGECKGIFCQNTGIIDCDEQDDVDDCEDINEIGL